LALYGSLSLVALLISAGRGDVDIYTIEGTSTGTMLLLSPLIGVALGLFVVVVSRFATYRYEWGAKLHREFGDILGDLTGREILVLALASSVGEELFFRGALLPWIGLWPHAIVFALLHVARGTRFVSFLPWTATAFVIGLAFGWLCNETGDLGGPIVAHFTINYLNLKFICRVKLPERDDGPSPASEGDSDSEPAPQRESP